jgi:exodeoxyribonuclease VII small subunit
MPAQRKPSTEAENGAGAPEAPAGEYDGLGYEQARDALADVVRRLEAGNLTLEESLALWERGEALADVCRQRLDGARARLAAALGEPEGSAGA